MKKAKGKKKQRRPENERFRKAISKDVQTIGELLDIQVPTISFLRNIISLPNGRYALSKPDIPYQENQDDFVVQKGPISEKVCKEIDNKGIFIRGLRYEGGILVATHAEGKELCGIPDILFTVAHELRHCWQHQHNIVGLTQTACDMFDKNYFTCDCEVDADAFALSYIEKYTSTSRKALSFAMMKKFEQDHGLRYARMKEIEKLLPEKTAA